MQERRVQTCVPPCYRSNLNFFEIAFKLAVKQRLSLLRVFKELELGCTLMYDNV